MNTDPQQIRTQVDAILAEIPAVDAEGFAGQPHSADRDADGDAGDVGQDAHDAGAHDIDVIGRRLEEAHQILVDALESVEKG